MRLLVERQRVLVADEVEQVLDRADRCRRGDLDDMRVNEGLSSLARDRHAMVAVLHEVRLADLVQIDWRQLPAVVVRAVDALPPVTRFHLPRPERAVKVAIPADASAARVE